MLHGSVRADSLGTFGRVYPVQEPSMLEAIQEKLKGWAEGDRLAQMEDEYRSRVIASINHPSGLLIPKAQQAASHYFDPTIITTEDIRGADGELVIPAGQAINPLDQMPLTKSLLFIDGEDAAQVAWLQQRLKLEPRAVPVLVAGSWLQLRQRLERPVYFDQQGFMTGRLGVRAVPSRVYQEDRRIRIDEVAL
ncbi:conjugal transfer pilus assembly protein TraW [Fluviicoccus keumensis]|uniref:Conjugal transfer pilus assembly protein TraW n=2 Tax=Fluviicoccus keumensis TaxID=1435465 RepID=A0A4Q7YJS5_9GAMM|nr:conjugal transfer pilus assembly protein TraW [Fluviicoccus keumensis]